MLPKSRDMFPAQTATSKSLTQCQSCLLPVLQREAPQRLSRGVVVWDHGGVVKPLLFQFWGRLLPESVPPPPPSCCYGLSGLWVAKQDSSLVLARLLTQQFKEGLKHPSCKGACRGLPAWEAFLNSLLSITVKSAGLAELHHQMVRSCFAWCFRS